MCLTLDAFIISVFDFCERYIVYMIVGYVFHAFSFVYAISTEKQIV